MNKISILMPVYNREQFLPIAIKSAIEQTHQDIELIIYNDGSTDKSLKIAQGFARKDRRIQVISNSKNHGVSVARNILLDACTTQYATWLDSDDVLQPTKIKQQFAAMEVDSLIFTGWAWLHQTGNNKWIPRFVNSESRAFATVMFPVDKSVKFKTHLQIGGEDWDFLARMEQRFPVVVIHDCLYHVRYHHDRIGAWKKKFRDAFTREQILSHTYAELIEMYQNR